MTNKNVIEIINRLMDPNADKVAYNATEVFTAIVHGYYYIRPGQDTVNFIKRINKVLDKGRKVSLKTFNKMKDGLPFEVWLEGQMSSEALCIARSMFDEEYYASQVARMVMYEKYDESLLERYMCWLDDEELESVFKGLVTFKLEYDAFISDENFDLMTDELEEKSVAVVQESSCYAANYDVHMDCIQNTPDFCFMYLCKESIIDTICKYVDEDPMMLASMIKAFKYSNAPTAAEYTGLAMCLNYEFELNIFDPKITDMSKIRLEDYDYRHSKVIHSNKTGKFITVDPGLAIPQITSWKELNF